MHQILISPLVTEKMTNITADKGKYGFLVNPKANKIQIKNAVEHLFKVKVDKVRTANMHGKKKRMGTHFGQRPDWKKAVISLAEGHKIDFLEQL
jgi:large subunit ribosomal protein L23